MKVKIKIGDRVRYKDKDDGIYFVNNIYSDTEVSLGLKDYPDVEQDYVTDIKDIVKVKSNLEVLENGNEKHNKNI